MCMYLIIVFGDIVVGLLGVVCVFGMLIGWLVLLFVGILIFVKFVKFLVILYYFFFVGEI